MPMTGQEKDALRNLALAGGGGAGIGALAEWLLKGRVTWRGPVAGGVFAPVALGSLHAGTRKGLVSLAGLGPRGPKQMSPEHALQRDIGQRQLGGEEAYRTAADEYIAQSGAKIDSAAAAAGIDPTVYRQLLKKNFTATLRQNDQVYGDTLVANPSSRPYADNAWRAAYEETMLPGRLHKAVMETEKNRTGVSGVAQRAWESGRRNLAYGWLQDKDAVSLDPHVGSVSTAENVAMSSPLLIKAVSKLTKIPVVGKALPAAGNLVNWARPAVTLYKHMTEDERAMTAREAAIGGNYPGYRERILTTANDLPYEAAAIMTGRGGLISPLSNLSRGVRTMYEYGPKALVDSSARQALAGYLGSTGRWYAGMDQKDDGLNTKETFDAASGLDDWKAARDVLLARGMSMRAATIKAREYATTP